MEYERCKGLRFVFLKSSRLPPRPSTSGFWKLALLLHGKRHPRCFPRHQYQTYFSVTLNTHSAVQCSEGSAHKTTCLNAAKNARRRLGGMTCRTVERLAEVLFLRWGTRSTRWWCQPRGSVLILASVLSVNLLCGSLERGGTRESHFLMHFCSGTSTYCCISAASFLTWHLCSFIFFSFLYAPAQSTLTLQSWSRYIWVNTVVWQLHLWFFFGRQRHGRHLVRNSSDVNKHGVELTPGHAKDSASVMCFRCFYCEFYCWQQ